MDGVLSLHQRHGVAVATTLPAVAPLSIGERRPLVRRLKSSPRKRNRSPHQELGDHQLLLLTTDGTEVMMVTGCN